MQYLLCQGKTKRKNVFNYGGCQAFFGKPSRWFLRTVVKRCCCRWVPPPSPRRLGSQWTLKKKGSITRMTALRKTAREKFLRPNTIFGRLHLNHVPIWMNTATGCCSRVQGNPTCIARGTGPFSRSFYRKVWIRLLLLWSERGGVKILSGRGSWEW